MDCRKDFNLQIRALRVILTHKIKTFPYGYCPFDPKIPLHIQHVTVVGCGTMGNGIAQVFATCGFAVELVDLSAPALEKAMSTIARNLDRVVAKGGLDHESRDAALARIHCGTSLAEATHQADLVVEAATENRQIKLELFRQLDQLSPPPASWPPTPLPSRSPILPAQPGAPPRSSACTS